MRSNRPYVQIDPDILERARQIDLLSYLKEFEPGNLVREIEKRIGVQTDTSTADKELVNYESKLKEVDLNKARLENEIDNLPVDARFRERKIHDMTLRLDALYDTMVELEERIEDAKLRRTLLKWKLLLLKMFIESCRILASYML